MSGDSSFSQYRNRSIISSYDENSDEYVEASIKIDSSKHKSTSSYDDGDEEISETDSYSNISSDEDKNVYRKPKHVKKIESSDEELEEKKAIYSPRTRRSIHGFRNPISSEEEESFSEEEINSSEGNSALINKTSPKTNEVDKLKSREISKFSKLYDSKSAIDQSIGNNRSGNASVCFNSSIANKMSSTITDTLIGNESKQNQDRIKTELNTEKSIEVIDNKNDIIEINTSDESVSLVTSTPDIVANSVKTRKDLDQPKISVAINTTPKSSHQKLSNLQPQFVSKEYLNRELRKLEDLKMELLTCQNLLRVNVNLPDGGTKMRDRVEKCKVQIKKHANYVSNLVVDEEEIKNNRSIGIDKGLDPNRNNSNHSQNSYKAPSWDELAAAVEAIKPKYTGSQGLATFAAQKAMTVDRLKDIHDSLETCPDDAVLADNPKLLNIELMNHQRHALAWMQWRERQKPRGGILADDMGLGKTLTMISLILAQRENNNSNVEADSADEESDNSKGWLSKGRKDNYDGGTLVVCPASLLQQWENEIANRCKKNALQVIVHHGNNRDSKARHLAKNDVVVTTYHIVAREFKSEGTLFRIKWERIIIDEAHVIRNHKAQMSVSVCGLKSKCRWALTGTPVQNKEMDLYAIIKFLKCSPFDDLAHWKKWIDNKSAGGQARLNTLMKSLLLRRTKIQLQESDCNFNLPKKTTKLIEVMLEKEEMNVYQRVMAYSQTLFAQFLHQRAEKHNDLYYGNENNAPTFSQIKDPNGAFFKMHKKMSQLTGNNKEVKSFEILVLLLRLRQICCHPCLIDTMLEDEDLNQTETSDGLKEVDLLKQLEKLQIEEENQSANSSENFNNSEENNIAKAAAKVLKKNNPVFDRARPSSKVNKVLDVLEENLRENSDKAIVVSQWTSLLDLINIHLKKNGYRTVSLNGTVPVKNRNEIVTTFNDEKSKIRIMLLSLTAGGVGLNLVGANHLLLIDLHWNPQLENQAQDRIYRVGQKKPVFIYKFMVKESVEERIKNLQDKKLEIANGVLTGAKSQGSKLTMEDLKGLFGL